MTADPLHELLARPPHEALPLFLDRWFGFRGWGAGTPVTQRLPSALRAFYAFAGTAPGVFSVNRFLAPADVQREDGHVIFHVEEQWVHEWAVAESDLDEDDPPVWGRFTESGATWTVESDSVSEFLLQVAVLNVALDPPYGAACACSAPEAARAALAPLRPLALREWQWPAHPTRFLAGETAVAMVCPNPHPAGDDPAVSVWVGAHEEDALAFLDPDLTEGWDRF